LELVVEMPALSSDRWYADLSQLLAADPAMAEMSPPKSGRATDQS
jgi:hypothetical protein